MQRAALLTRSAAAPDGPVFQARAVTNPPAAPAERIAAPREGTSLLDIPSHSNPAEAGGASRLPAPLRSGLETLSGLAMDDVRVHRGSPEPARLGALAFARGSDIHLGPGQERHLPHEAWHVVQQKQGRVAATAQMKGMGLNNEAGLEAEADRMGDVAQGSTPAAEPPLRAQPGRPVLHRPVVQRKVKKSDGSELKVKEQMSEVLRDYVKDKRAFVLRDLTHDLTALPVHLFDTGMKYLLGEQHDYEGSKKGDVEMGCGNTLMADHS